MVKNLFILLIICALLLFGGKYYIEKRYEGEFDKQISLYGAPISYESIKLGFDGSFAINGFEATEPKSGEKMRYGAITIKTSDRFLAFKLLKRRPFANGNYPNSVNVKVERMLFNASMIESSAKEGQCRSLPTSLQHKQIGEEQIRADLEMAINFSDPYNTILDLYYSDSMGTFDIQSIVDFDGMVAAMRSDEELPLREASIKAELNPAAAASLSEYCGSIHGISPEEYLVDIVGSSEFSLSSFPADLGPQFREGLTNFMRGGVTANIRSKPSDQLLKLSNAKFFKPRDVLRLLNLSIFVDGELIPLTIVEAAVVAEEEKPKREPARKLAKYEQVNIAQVASYVNKDVRVSRSKGRKAIRGRLVGVADGRLSIESYRFSGEMTLKVAIGDVSKLEVLSQGE